MKSLFLITHETCSIVGAVLLGAALLRISSIVTRFSKIDRACIIKNIFFSETPLGINLKTKTKLL